MTNNLRAHKDITYKVVINPIKEVGLGLSNMLAAEVANKKSDKLSLSLTGENIDRSQANLNTIIRSFDQDGILDQQLV